MINNYLKTISLLFCIAALSHGENLVSETYSVDAGFSYHILNNKLTDVIHIPTFGIHCSFPVGIERTSISFAAEYGKIGKTEKVIHTAVLVSNISLGYTFLFCRDVLSLTPMISIENCALHLHKSGKVDDFVIIANWENEFGTGVGFEVGYRWKLVTVTVQQKLSTIFAGNPAYIYSCGIRSGIEFGKKGTVRHE
jgi:hypothetical protein